MAESMISLAYGKALFEAARGRGKAEQIYQELKAAAWMMDAEPQIFRFLCSAEHGAEQKKEIVRILFDGRLCTEMVRFLQMLAEKGRIWHLDRIVRQYERLYEKEDGFLPKQTYSGNPLKLLQESDIRGTLESFRCA